MPHAVKYITNTKEKRNEKTKVIAKLSSIGNGDSNHGRQVSMYRQKEKKWLQQ